MDIVIHENNKGRLIVFMRDLDYLDMDGRGLRLFLAVFDEGSVTVAAQRLNVTQSAVSHMLDKLREILKDPLFVRSGRGITPTPRAVALADEIRPILSSLKKLADPPVFDPSICEDEFVIAASGYQRELIMPPLLKIIRKAAPGLRLKITDSRFWEIDMFRNGQCDLMITPAAPDGLEFIQRRLFKDRWVCFYDTASGSPAEMKEFLRRPHAKVVFTSDERSALDRALEAEGHSRHIALRVSSFSALPNLMRGTDIIIAQPQHISKTIMRDFSQCPLPIMLPEFTVYLVWHTSQSENPLNRWLRQELLNIVRQLRL